MKEKKPKQRVGTSHTPKDFKGERKEKIRLPILLQMEIYNCCNQ